MNPFGVKVFIGKSQASSPQDSRYLIDKALVLRLGPRIFLVIGMQHKNFILIDLSQSIATKDMKQRSKNDTTTKIGITERKRHELR